MAQLSQQEKDIQDRMHDLDMRIQEFQKNNDRGNVPKPIISQRSVGVNTPPFEELVPKPRNNANNAIAFNMIMRILKRGNMSGAVYQDFTHFYVLRLQGAVSILLYSLEEYCHK